ncbi:MAG: sigma-70 family RNA polymerase sigma factor [Anaerolineales bacterium]|nr:sigma-70 family RNA polymerase sigma factor [Anaerolineales bacterium]
MTTTQPEKQELARVIADCRQEAAAAYESETDACFELFRRAIDLQDALAWAAIEEQYRDLILHWLLPGSRLSTGDVETADLLQATLLRFWRTLSTLDVPLRSRFPHVGALLNYLKKCAITVRLDWQRRQQREQRLRERLQREQSFFRDQLATQLEKRDVLARQAAVQAWLQENLQDAQERLVYELSYVAELKPREIAAQYPAEFASAKAVYRVKLRLIKRMQRTLAPLLDE